MKGPRVRSAGITLLEVSIGIAILLIVSGVAITALNGAQTTFVQNEIISQVRTRAQRAMERIVQLASKAVSDDPGYFPFEPTTGVNSHGLQFRLIESTEPVTGNPIYDANAVFIFGPDPAPWPNNGLIVGRGTSMNEVWTETAGTDGTLGTEDDNVRAMATTDQPHLEILIPEGFEPSTGDLFRVNVSPAPIGRLITITLRLNAQSANGDFLLPDDLEISERIALRQ